MTEKRFLELAKECGVTHVTDIIMGCEDNEKYVFFNSFSKLHREDAGHDFWENGIRLNCEEMSKEIALLYVAWLKEIENE